MKIQESAENYLETIYMLSLEHPYVRSIDIATELSFSKPSVSVAMKNLRENGYIRMDDQGHITLTESGMEIANTMYERHVMLTNWLIYLGVNPKTAAGGRLPHGACGERRELCGHQEAHHPGARAGGRRQRKRAKRLRPTRLAASITATGSLQKEDIAYVKGSC